MAGRVEGKAALIIGGGQTPGEGIGNGRAVAVVLAREGATVVVADRELSRAEETVAMIVAAGGKASAIQCDVTNEEDVGGAIAESLARLGKLDILHNNVGASIALGDAPAIDLTEDAFDRSFAVNLKSMWLTCKHAMPALRRTEGSIVNISSLAAVGNYPLLGYKTMKAATVALTENLAMAEAGNGVRVNAILPGLMATPMAIEARVAQGTPREQVIAARERRVPLRRKMGSAWDVANAALFLHSDEASYITGISLMVDGGMSIDIPA